MDGYLGLYGLCDWYCSQSKEVQEYLYKSSGYGINTDSSRLTTGRYHIFHMPKELTEAVGTDDFSKYYDQYWPNTPDSVISIPYNEHIPTATSFLCSHAQSAFKDRQHEIAKIILAEAKRRISDDWDLSIYDRTCENTYNSASEKEISAAIPLVIQFLRKNPGFMQSELSKQPFAGVKQDAIGMAAYRLRQEGKIRREKKGRSFQLWIVEGI